MDRKALRVGALRVYATAFRVNSESGKECHSALLDKMRTWTWSFVERFSPEAKQTAVVVVDC